MVLHYDIKSILLILLPPNRNGLIKQWLWDCVRAYKAWKGPPISCFNLVGLILGMIGFSTKSKAPLGEHI